MIQEMEDVEKKKEGSREDVEGGKRDRIDRMRRDKEEKDNYKEMGIIAEEEEDR